MFKTQKEMEEFIQKLVEVIPSHEAFPEVLTIPGLKLLEWHDFRYQGQHSLGFQSQRGYIKLVDKELYTLEEKYQDRITRIEKLLAEQK